MLSVRFIWSRLASAEVFGLRRLGIGVPRYREKSTLGPTRGNLPTVKATMHDLEGELGACHVALEGSVADRVVKSKLSVGGNSQIPQPAN